MEIPQDGRILRANRNRKVMKMSYRASALADSTSPVEGVPSAAVSVANLFRVKNELRGFSLAFP